jgi:hypothetical protein
LEPLAKSQATDHFGNSSVGTRSTIRIAGISIVGPTIGVIAGVPWIIAATVSATIAVAISRIAIAVAISRITVAVAVAISRIAVAISRIAVAVVPAVVGTSSSSDE